MVRLTWILTVAAVIALFYGLRTGRIDPLGSEYLAIMVAIALLLGFSTGFLAATGAARLRWPGWLALVAALAGCAAGVAGLVRAAMELLPPVYYAADIMRYADVPAWRIIAWFAAPASAVACLPAFGVWRWWHKGR